MSDHDNFNDEQAEIMADAERFDDTTEPTFDQLAGDDVYGDTTVGDDTEPIERPSEETADAAESVPAEPQIEVVGPRSRVFVIGGTRIPEGEHTTSMTAEQVRESLKAMFPEVANATIREREEGGVSYVEFLPQAGRKG